MTPTAVHDVPRAVLTAIATAQVPGLSDGTTVWPLDNYLSPEQIEAVAAAALAAIVPFGWTYYPENAFAYATILDANGIEVTEDDVAAWHATFVPHAPEGEDEE